MKNKIKLYGGAVIALSLIACSGKNNQTTSLSSFSNKPISAKSFLRMSSNQQQEVLNHFQKNCDEPAILEAASQDPNLKQKLKRAFESAYVYNLGGGDASQDWADR